LSDKVYNKKKTIKTGENPILYLRETM
jgi:hypothetical protein